MSCPTLLACRTIYHSYPNESTGFVRAAFRVWKLTVTKDTNRTINPANKKMFAEMVVRYGKLSIQPFITHHTMGVANAIDKLTSLMYSLERSKKIPLSVEPSTLRTPIS